MPQEDNIQELRGRLLDEFSAQLLNGALQALAQTSNPGRVQ
jgi:hypothetical protein